MNFPFFPQQASTLAGQVDALMLFVFSMAVFFAVLIAGLIVFFSIKYHHRAQADRSREENADDRVAGQSGFFLHKGD